MSLKDIRREFTAAASADVHSTAKSSHTVSRGTLEGSDKTWIKKEMPDPAVARIEILAQEFFRLIIPHQGETRLLRNHVTGVHYILSEEVPGYRNLPEYEAANFGNGRYTGLGQVLVTAMFLQEIDLKNGNLGLDAQNRVAKIDGDWCFAEARYQGPYAITPKAIERLPYPEGFTTFNWLDLVIEANNQRGSSIVEPRLATNPQFRAEVNQAMLMISLLPDSFIDKFVDAYMPAGGERFVELITSRRKELRASALQNESFKAYIASPQAAKDTANLITQMNSFVANDAGPVVAEEERLTLTSEVNENLAQLKHELLPKELDRGSRIVTPPELTMVERPSVDVKVNADSLNSETESLIADNRKLLATIRTHKINERDTVLEHYVTDREALLATFHDNPEQLAHLKTALTKVLESVSSAEVQAVKDAAQDLRKKSTEWFSRGRDAKAQRIEDALCSTPVHLRGKVISQDGPSNTVQEALASHRHLGKGGKVYKEGEYIKMNEAAATFKRLKEEFKANRSASGPESGAEGDSDIRTTLLK